MIFSDRKLSQKLERTEGRANASFVEARAIHSPHIGAEWISEAGVYAMFDGVQSPLTQTFGLGIFDDVTGATFDRLEKFFQKHGAPVFHEVSAMADASLLGLLNERGYRPVELSSVLFQPIKPEMPAVLSQNPQIETRIARSGEEELWARVSSDGWATEMEGLGDFMFEFGQISATCDGGFPFLAELAGDPIAAGMLFIYDDVALLAGASTIPSGRRKGAQLALLDARLRFATARGCRLAMMCTYPGSGSQKNAEKNGFRTAYTRTKWQLV